MFLRKSEIFTPGYNLRSCLENIKREKKEAKEDRQLSKRVKRRRQKASIDAEIDIGTEVSLKEILRSGPLPELPKALSFANKESLDLEGSPKVASPEKTDKRTLEDDLSNVEVRIPRRRSRRGNSFHRLTGGSIMHTQSTGMLPIYWDIDSLDSKVRKLEFEYFGGFGGGFDTFEGIFWCRGSPF